MAARIESQSARAITIFVIRIHSTELPYAMLDRTPANPADSSYRPCPAHVPGLLLKVFDAGLTSASREDLEDLLACIDILCPEGLAVYLASVRLHIRYADWIGAVRLLKRLEATQTLNPLSLALMAGCLFKLGDHDWQRYAATLMRGEQNPRAEAILKTFVRGAVAIPGAASRPAETAQIDHRPSVYPLRDSKTSL
ncbi:MAG: HrpB1 family type III secretion system apparatus protein [Paraburkholderia sp.]|jgi:type III secretion protein HrpB1|nr:HrpB1 family type III secretion system apparatus protein [Paraburkholderia sp.]